MGVILQVALPSRELAAARLQCGAAGAGASRGLGVCAEHARLAARGESARAMEIGEFLGRLRRLGPGRFSQCVSPTQGRTVVAVREPRGRLERLYQKTLQSVPPWRAPQTPVYWPVNPALFST